MRRILPACLLALLVGCGPPKLNHEKDFDVDYGGQTFNMVPAKVEQTIMVDAVATGNTIDVFVFLAKDKAAVDKGLLTNKIEGVIASKDKQQTAFLEAKIPPNENWTVMVRASTPKSANVKLKIKN
jgi:hypothetical protein